jgi:hypothetical protein
VDVVSNGANLAVALVLDGDSLVLGLLLGLVEGGLLGNQFAGILLVLFGRYE